jgi:hypothetical protein
VEERFSSVATMYVTKSGGVDPKPLEIGVFSTKEGGEKDSGRLLAERGRRIGHLQVDLGEVVTRGARNNSSLLTTGDSTVPRTGREEDLEVELVGCSGSVTVSIDFSRLDEGVVHTADISMHSANTSQDSTYLYFSYVLHASSQKQYNKKSKIGARGWRSWRGSWPSPTRS